MSGQTLDPLPLYWTIGQKEHLNLMMAMKRPLSGYLGGQRSTGRFIRQLTEDWKAEFGVKFAVPCNSGTSGLMAACMAAGIGPGDEVWVSTYTMSATATCALILGATVHFADIDATFFGMDLRFAPQRKPKAIIVTNLFGCAAELTLIREICDQLQIVMIEDNAQAPYATYGGQYAGTIGHMGVFSLNVHKHIQCGEGGVVVTNDDHYAEQLEWAINHGELAPVKYHNKYQQMGGNFRMTEPIAAIACAQLKKGFANVQTRIALADALTDIFRQVAFVEPPAKRSGDRHAFYLWAGKITGPDASYRRAALVQRVGARGVPFRVGYSTPLHQLFQDDVELPVAEELENERLFTFEVCAYDPKLHHLNRMRDIILEEAETLEKEVQHEGHRKRGDRGLINILGSH